MWAVVAQITAPPKHKIAHTSYAPHGVRFGRERLNCVRPNAKTRVPSTIRAYRIYMPNSFTRLTTPLIDHVNCGGPQPAVLAAVERGGAGAETTHTDGSSRH
jgi:hypothetical protein